ncbi:hypothetical protein [Microcystis sp.]|jgi:hypothetical protein|uniref:hypothetical protein n=1 Tax=Microcystis sp. TaxID=1127 RepID=UPI003AF5162A
MNELDNLYDLILENLSSLNKSQGKSLNIQSYLQSLQPDVKRLRSSFHTNHVSVDYSNYNTQAAYLLAYYPHYVEMTYRALESLQQKDPSLMQLVFDKKHLKVCLFCAGAAPEALGLLSFVRQFYPEVKSIVIYSYDLYSDTWRTSQDITKNIINNCFKDYHFALLTRTLNINYVKDVTKIMPTIESTDIFMLQNCLNELKTNQLQSIIFLLNYQPERSLLLINDLKKHKIAQNMERQIQSKISYTKLESKREYNQEIFRQFAGGNDFKSSLKLPSILRENLLTGEDGLIPREKTSYSYVCVYKVFSDVGNSPELDTFYNSGDLSEQVNRLPTQFNSFDVKLEQLLAVESNYLKISEIVESYDQKLEEFQTTLQKEKDTIQADLETLISNIQNLETKNSKQEIKLEEIERRLNRFEEERKNLTRQLERNRKAVIFAILISLLGVILGVIALFQ